MNCGAEENIVKAIRVLELSDENVEMFISVALKMMEHGDYSEAAAIMIDVCRKINNEKVNTLTKDVIALKVLRKSIEKINIMYASNTSEEVCSITLPDWTIFDYMSLNNESVYLSKSEALEILSEIEEKINKKYSLNVN
jgi:hypothetical protein